MMAVIERQAFIMGAEVRQLEAAVAALSQTKHAIGCASGTDALLLPLKALDCGRATRSSRRRSLSSPPRARSTTPAATPVFVDIDPATFNISPAAVEAAITPRTRAIVAGATSSARWRPIEALVPLAARHGLALIEDAAQSIGARRKIGRDLADGRRARHRRHASLLSQQEPRRATATAA